MFVDARAFDFKFEHHYIDVDLPGKNYGQTSLVDVDKDGDLDFICGQNNGDVFWFEFQGPDKWVRHLIGHQSMSDVGGVAIDVDGDGWVDHVAGGVWYRNPKDPRNKEFERFVFDPDLKSVHDLVAADIDGDGKLDIVTMSDKQNLRWYKIPKDPTERWERHDIGPGVHAGVAVGDINGDGHLDIVRSNAWFENADGKGTKWIMHENIPFGNPKPPYPLATRARICDINKDGKMDIVMTENEIKGGKIGWVENVDGKGMEWKLHLFEQADKPVRGAYHSLAVADFDGDGDLDVFSCEMEAIAGDKQPRWYIWENVDGKGAQFVEHVIFDGKLGGHEAVVGDVDGDGDLDICAKLWFPRKDNAAGGKLHADFLENMMVKKK